jgi:hypothetical protein
MIPNRECPKCPRGQGIMEGEVQEIPRSVPLALPLNITIKLDPYIPNILQRYKYYVIYVCRTCGFVEFFVYNG